jgi:hypothetical protein
VAKNSGVTAAKRADGLPVGTPFQPGQSGNPNGLPKGSVNIKAELQKIIDLKIKNEHNPFTDEVEDEMPVGRKIALNMAINAAAGDQNACKDVRDTIDGKPAQSINVGGQGENTRPN